MPRPYFTEDDFNPKVISGADEKNIGDLDGDGLLDTNEVWKYSASVVPAVQMTITPTAGGPTYDAGMLHHETLANGDIRVYYRQDNNFNDNTYGTGSDIGWTSQGRTHKFGDLTGSDKAGFALGGAIVLLVLAVENERISKPRLDEAQKFSMQSHQALTSNLRNSEVIEAMGMLARAALLSHRTARRRAGASRETAGANAPAVVRRAGRGRDRRGRRQSADRRARRREDRVVNRPAAEPEGGEVAEAVRFELTRGANP